MVRTAAEIVRRLFSNNKQKEENSKCAGFMQSYLAVGVVRISRAPAVLPHDKHRSLWVSVVTRSGRRWRSDGLDLTPRVHYFRPRVDRLRFARLGAPLVQFAMSNTSKQYWCMIQNMLYGLKPRRWSGEVADLELSAGSLI